MEEKGRGRGRVKGEEEEEGRRLGGERERGKHYCQRREKGAQRTRGHMCGPTTTPEVFEMARLLAVTTEDGAIGLESP